MAYSTGQCSGFTSPGVRCRNGGGCTDDHKNLQQSQANVTKTAGTANAVLAQEAGHGGGSGVNPLSPRETVEAAVDYQTLIGVGEMTTRGAANHLSAATEGWLSPRGAKDLLANPHLKSVLDDLDENGPLPTGTGHLDRPLFHGTDENFVPGDVISPVTKKHAHAAPSLATARVFAGDGKVYELEPIFPDDTWDSQMKYTGGEYHVETLSQVGYRVVGEVPADRPASYYGKEHMSENDHIQVWLADQGLSTMEDWLEDSGYYEEDDTWYNEDGDEVDPFGCMYDAFEVSYEGYDD